MAKTILLADDEEDNLYTCGYLLEAMGHKVVTAHNGQEAVAKAHELHPDLILMDVMMPVMDGYRATQALKQAEDTRAIPVILLTAKRTTEDIVQGLRIGADDYIPKPFEQMELQARVGAWLRFAELQQQLLSVRLAEELAIARQIQLSLLPKETPEVEGFGFAARYIPCEQVGGDYYDFLRLDEGHLAVVLADVEGHGIGAAMLMSSVSTALRTEIRHGFSLNKIMFDLNNFICAELSELTSMPLIYAVINLPIRTLNYVNAGHEFPLHYHGASGEVTELESTGMVLGIAEGMEYNEVHLPLAPGDRVVFFTDGLTDQASPKDEFFGEERVRALLREHPEVSAPEFSALLEQAVSAHRGTAPQNDDIAFVILTVVQPSASRQADSGGRPAGG
jgi:serine phosphatase RsbU (regulator of sigma subunit)